jgi:hypothetical protein
VSKPKFNEDHGGGYWIYRESPSYGISSHMAVIKKSGNLWFGGATESGATSVPLHGPYRLKRTAKKKALKCLALIREEDDE